VRVDGSEADDAGHRDADAGVQPARAGWAKHAYRNAVVSAECMTFISLLMLFFISGYAHSMFFPLHL
jgi:hypothetical protein